MRTRRLKQWIDDQGVQHTDVVWFGSYGTITEGSEGVVKCSDSVFVSDSLLVGSPSGELTTVAKFYNPSDKHDNFSSGQQSVVDSLTQRLSVIKHELWYDYDNGMPLVDKNRTRSAIDMYVLSVINNHPDVVSVSKFESKLNHTVYSCNVLIQSKYGPTTLQI